MVRRGVTPIPTLCVGGRAEHEDFVVQVYTTDPRSAYYYQGVSQEREPYSVDFLHEQADRYDQ